MKILGGVLVDNICMPNILIIKMSQQEIYTFLKSHPGEKFTIRDIEKEVTSCSRTSINLNLKRLIKCDDIHRVRQYEFRNGLGYLYWYEENNILKNTKLYK